MDIYIEHIEHIYEHCRPGVIPGSSSCGNCGSPVAVAVETACSATFQGLKPVMHAISIKSHHGLLPLLRRGEGTGSPKADPVGLIRGVT